MSYGYGIGEVNTKGLVRGGVTGPQIKGMGKAKPKGKAKGRILSDHYGFGLGMQLHLWLSLGLWSGLGCGKGLR